MAFTSSGNYYNCHLFIFLENYLYITLCLILRREYYAVQCNASQIFCVKNYLMLAS